MNSNLVETLVSFITGMLLVFTWLIGAYIVNGASATKTEIPSIKEDDVLKRLKEDLESLKEVRSQPFLKHMQAPVEPAKPTRSETLEMIKTADKLVEEVYQMHNEVGVLTDEVK